MIQCQKSHSQMHIALQDHLQKYIWMTSSSISVEIQSYSKKNNKKELFKSYGSSGENHMGRWRLPIIHSVYVEGKEDPKFKWFVRRHTKEKMITEPELLILRAQCFFDLSCHLFPTENKQHWNSIFLMCLIFIHNQSS